MIYESIIQNKQLQKQESRVAPTDLIYFPSVYGHPIPHVQPSKFGWKLNGVATLAGN